MFRVCSEYVQSMFRVCSEYVHSMFTACSEHVQSMFRVSSGYVQGMFRVCFISFLSASSVSVWHFYNWSSLTWYFQTLCRPSGCLRTHIRTIYSIFQIIRRPPGHFPNHSDNPQSIFSLFWNRKKLSCMSIMYHPWVALAWQKYVIFLVLTFYCQEMTMGWQ